MSIERLTFKPSADDVETDVGFSQLNQRSLNLRRPLFGELREELIKKSFLCSFHRFLILGLASGKEAILVAEYLAAHDATVTGVDLYNDIDPILEKQFPLVYSRIIDGKNQKTSVLDFLNNSEEVYDFVLVSTGRKHGLFTNEDGSLLAGKVEENGVVVTVGDSVINRTIMEVFFNYQFSTNFEGNSMFEVWKKS